MERRRKLTELTFVDFLEALCRIALFKPLPTQRDYAELGAQTGTDVRDCAHFFSELHALGGEIDVAEWAGAHEPDWRVEETRAGRPLPETAELLCQLVVGRLDRDGDGKLSGADWKYAP